LSKQEAKKAYIELFKEVILKQLQFPGGDSGDFKESEFTNSAVYSSTATETKKEIDNHLSNLQDK
jgi:hypothetical protein